MVEEKVDMHVQNAPPKTVKEWESAEKVTGAVEEIS